MTTVYSLKEVHDKNATNNMLIVIYNNVYNITDFVNEHPGGEEVLHTEAGKDGTESFEDIGHSDEARAILKKYIVGKLDDASCQTNYKSNPIRAGELPKEESKRSVLRYVLPTLAVCILIYKYTLGRQRQ